MLSQEKLLSYMRQGVDDILNLRGMDKNGTPFTGGLTRKLPLRKTQREGFLAYRDFLDDKTISIAERLKGYFEIPTGVGKTAMFIKMVHGAHIENHKNRLSSKVENTSSSASEDFAKSAKKSDTLRSVIVVPTTNLLKQTRDEFIKFAPEMADQIGMYGGRNRQLKKPITLITYESWKNLTEKGKLSSDNVDVLISDEAHRGISQRSQDTFNAYGNSTLKIAFTATSRYDETRAVEQTHKHEIYAKHISQAVRDGELASYLQTQFFIIRVDPLDLDKPVTLVTEDGEEEVFFADMPREESARLMRRIKQEAWNKRAVKIFADGKDQHTDDLLSDNQAGFFVEDTYQADRLTDMLNADPKLQHKAAALGCKGVAVSIHSRLKPSGEDERRLEEYMAGKYLAIVGDEKFKEGFDHKPLKTIIDCPHGSLVDKAQILGRLARRWFNEMKNRQEGATFVDTVVYVGDIDPKRDKKLRDLAIKKAILATDILEDAVVLGPGVKPPKPKDDGENASATGPLAGDPNVTEYTELEDIKTLMEERERIRNAGTGLPIDLKDVSKAIDIFVKDNQARPSQISGDVTIRGYETTWGAINHMFMSGKFGNYTSLPNYLDKKKIGLFSEEDIVAVLKKFCVKNGYVPAEGNKGNYLVIGERKLKTTCRTLNIKMAKNNLFGCSRWAEFIEKHQIGAYELDDIAEAAIEFWVKNVSRPTTNSGATRVGPDKFKIAWDTLSDHFEKGKYPPYTGLPDFLDKKGIHTDFAEKDILKACQDYYKQKKKRPTNRTKKERVKINIRVDGKAREVSTTFNTIDRNMRAGDYPGYTSLPDFLNKNKVGKATVKSEKVDYTIDNILDAVRAYMKVHGKRPSSASKNPSTVDINGRSTTTTAISKALKTRAVKGSTYNTLKQLLDEHKIGIYTEDDILTAVQSYMSEHGKRPSLNQEKKAILNINEITLGAIALNVALSKGKVKGCSHKSLKKLLDAHGFPKEIDIKETPQEFEQLDIPEP